MSDDNVTAKFIRLQNGEDIVAETVEYEDESGVMYMLMHPLKAIYVRSPQEGVVSISFVPWVFPRLVDHQEFMIHANDVLMITDVSERMNIYYWDNLQALYGKTTPEPIEQEDNANENIEEMVEEIVKEIKRIYH